jgi:hypothetical protein
MVGTSAAALPAPAMYALKDGSRTRNRFDAGRLQSGVLVNSGFIEALIALLEAVLRRRIRLVAHRLRNS